MKEDYKRRLLESFGPDSEYEVDLGHPLTRDDLPISAPWRHKSLKEFISNFQDGKEKTGISDDPQVSSQVSQRVHRQLPGWEREDRNI